MDPKFLRNARHALHGTREAVRKLRKVCIYAWLWLRFCRFSDSVAGLSAVWRVHLQEGEGFEGQDGQHQAESVVVIPCLVIQLLTGVFFWSESGRIVPATLCGGEMVCMSNRNVMRLLLDNQTVLAKIFQQYSVR